MFHVFTELFRIQIECRTRDSTAGTENESQQAVLRNWSAFCSLCECCIQSNVFLSSTCDIAERRREEPDQPWKTFAVSGNDKFTPKFYRISLRLMMVKPWVLLMLTVLYHINTFTKTQVLTLISGNLF